MGRSLAALAWLLNNTGAVAESEATYRRAEERLVALTKTGGGDWDARAVLANCRMRRTVILDTTGRRAEAYSLNRFAREDLEKWTSVGASPEIQAVLARTLWWSALTLSGEGKQSQASEAFEITGGLEGGGEA